MKILWLCNIPHPDICGHIGVKASPGGNWIGAIYNMLKVFEDIEIVYCFPSSKNMNGAANGIKYYSFVSKRNADSMKELSFFFKELIEKESPDLIHIYGTESVHSNIMMQIAEPAKVLVSIQGLISKIALYARNSIPARYFYGFTFHDFAKFSNPYLKQCDMVARGKQEEKLLKRAKYVTGRTEWDRACVMQISEKVKYYHCGEILRPVFYDAQWSYQNCEKHTIFITNSYATYKGFHDLLCAMPYVLKKYPDTIIYAIGPDVFNISWLRKSVYNKYIKALINKYNLKDHIHFCNYLNGEEFVDMLKRVNVMALTSSIENSPNSLGEAMIVGTPVVAADVGGVKDMLVHGEEGFIYQQNAPYMLAHYICKVFELGEGVSEMTKRAQNHAFGMFDAQKNADTLVDIYKEIISKN